MRSLGFAACDDFKGEPGRLRSAARTIRDGRRDSTAVAYLRPARTRGNLEVLTHSLVTRIVIENGRATGIEWQRDGVTPAAARPSRNVVAPEPFSRPTSAAVRYRFTRERCAVSEIEVKHAWRAWALTPRSPGAGILMR